MNLKLENLPKNEKETVSKPNESGSFHVEGFIKVFDPNSKEVYVEKRA
jgi:hypothetical protein